MSPNRKHSIIALRRAESLWIDRVRVPYSVPGLGPLQGWQTRPLCLYLEAVLRAGLQNYFFHDMRCVGRETTRSALAKQSDLFSDVPAYSYHRPSGLKPPYRPIAVTIHTFSAVSSRFDRELESDLVLQMRVRERSASGTLYSTLMCGDN